MKKIAINGFGRIGRTIFRAWLEREIPEVEIVAVNNPVKGDIKKAIEDYLHLLKYDSVHGHSPFKDIHMSVEFDGAKYSLDIKFNKTGKSKKVTFHTEMQPEKIEWSADNVELVIDSTGVFKDKTTLGKHISGTVKKVIMSAPGENLDGTFVVGVNADKYDATKHHIVSNASCTTNCLAPLVKVLDDKFGIEKGMMNTTHSYTADQRLIDSEHADRRRSRSAALSMIPTTTGAAKAIGEVLPHLKGKLDGCSIRVPTPNVSVVDFTVILKKNVTKEEVNQALSEAANGALKGILALSNEELVSVDYNGNTHSSSADAKFTQVVGDNMVKILSWYDNETGYSNRMLDLALIMLK